MKVYRSNRDFLRKQIMSTQKQKCVFDMQVGMQNR